MDGVSRVVAVTCYGSLVREPGTSWAGRTRVATAAKRSSPSSRRSDQPPKRGGPSNPNGRQRAESAEPVERTKPKRSMARETAAPGTAVGSSHEECDRVARASWMFRDTRVGEAIRVVPEYAVGSGSKRTVSRGPARSVFRRVRSTEQTGSALGALPFYTIGIVSHGATRMHQTRSRTPVTRIFGDIVKSTERR